MQSVCAVIVTFNRKQQLAACLNSLLHAERTPKHIVVVDNASSDGTPEFVEHEFESVKLIRQPTNAGCAGGFKAGIQKALETDCELIWLMDDDHTAEPDALARLTGAARANNCDVFGPILLAPGTNDELTTVHTIAGQRCRSYTDLISLVGQDGVIDQVPTPFNGVVYRANALRRLGLPDDRLFIRGDDLDYWLRIQQKGLRAVIVAGARMRHPSMFHQDFVVLSGLGRTLMAHYTGNRLKDYCLFRNRAYCFRKYKRYRILGMDMLRYILFFLLTRRADYRGLLLWANAYLHGLFGRFGYERRFLGLRA